MFLKFFYGFLKDCNAVEFSYTTLDQDDDDVTRYPGIVVIAGHRGSNITGSKCFDMFFFLVITELNFMGDLSSFHQSGHSGHPA